MKHRLIPGLLSVVSFLAFTGSLAAASDSKATENQPAEIPAVPEKPALPATELPEPIRGKNYKLVFREEFDGSKGAKASKSRWSDWDLGPRGDAVNVDDACKLDGKGHLAIELRRDKKGRYETGGIDTRKQFQATHGYFECRAKVLECTGAWSAFWLQSQSNGNPLGDAGKAGVEIDIFEHLAGSDVVQHNAHWDGYAKENHKKDYASKHIPDLAKVFRTYAVKWDESGYTFYVDGVESGRWKKAPVSNHPEFILLSCEVGKWGGDIAKAKLPAQFVIDHVRVWQTPEQIAADRKRRK